MRNQALAPAERHDIASGMTSRFSGAGLSGSVLIAGFSVLSPVQRRWRWHTRRGRRRSVRSARRTSGRRRRSCDSPRRVTSRPGAFGGVVAVVGEIGLVDDLRDPATAPGREVVARRMSRTCSRRRGGRARRHACRTGSRRPARPRGRRRTRTPRRGRRSGGSARRGRRAVDVHTGTGRPSHERTPSRGGSTTRPATRSARSWTAATAVSRAVGGK